MDATLSTTTKISDLVTGIRTGKIIFDPPFQRRKIWSNKDKSFLIDTILKKLPFPEIYTAIGTMNVTTGETQILIVDGQQRVSTIYDYFSAAPTLSLSDDVPEYKSLSKNQKEDFLNYVVAVRDLKSISKPEMIEVFRRLNVTSYDANSMEVSNALYSGPLKKFAEETSERAFFEENRFFTPNQFRRMGDVRYCLTLIVSMMAGYFNRDDLLEEYLVSHNETFGDEATIKKRVTKTLEFIENLGIHRRSKFWKQSDFFNVFVELDQLLSVEGQDLKETDVAERLESFYKLWNEDIDDSNIEVAKIYDRASRSAANDKRNRGRRGRIVRSVILGEKISDKELALIR